MTTSNPKEIEQLKASGKILATVLNMVASRAVAGVSAAELNQYAESEIEKAGGKPSFKSYGKPAFPAGLCVSINDEVVHGVPAKGKVLKEGDIVGLDLGVDYH